MGVRSVLTVTVAAASYDLTTLLDVLADMNMDGTNEKDKAILRRWITQVSAVAAEYCNRVFLSETVSETLYPDRDAYPYQVPGVLDVLQLARWPISSITSITENGTALVEDTDFKTVQKSGQLIRLDSNGFKRNWTTLPVVAVYVAGYAQTAIPMDLQTAAINLVKARWFARDRDPALRSRGEPGLGNVAYWIGMAPDVVATLDNYRVPSVG